ncbi:MAG: aquaporin, partial [Sphingomonadaceae bacterium]|nr:aquaporin [Sphingomonadaceae bacterium]
LYITAAYWFTSSTSFANPAITVARSLSDSFAGIAPADVLAFIAAQLIGAMAGALTGGAVFGRSSVDHSARSAVPLRIENDDSV